MSRLILSLGSLCVGIALTAPAFADLLIPGRETGVPSSTDDFRALVGWQQYACSALGQRSYVAEPVLGVDVSVPTTTDAFRSFAAMEQQYADEVLGHRSYVTEPVLGVDVSVPTTTDAFRSLAGARQYAYDADVTVEGRSGFLVLNEICSATSHALVPLRYRPVYPEYSLQPVHPVSEPQHTEDMPSGAW